MKKATLIALLIGIGVDKANAEKMAALTPDDGTEVLTQPEIEAVVSSWKEQQKTLHKNDPTIVEEIQKAERAKQLDQFERKIKQTFGLTSEEIKDKKFDEIVALAKSKATTGTDKTSAELQQKILELENENKRLMEEEIPKERSAAEQYKKNFDKKVKLRSLIPVGDDKIRVPFETAESLVISDIESAYDTELDDKGNWVIKQKGTDLIAKSSDGTKFLTMDELINSRLEHHKLLVKSNAGAGGGTGTGKDPNKKYGADGKEIIVDAGEGKKIPSPALKKAMEHEAAMKAEAEANK